MLFGRDMHSYKIRKTLHIIEGRDLKGEWGNRPRWGSVNLSVCTDTAYGHTTHLLI